MQLFIIEGPDGSGKSTLIQCLQHAISHDMLAYRNIRWIRHPGASSFGQVLRSVLKDPENKIDPITYQIIMAAETQAFIEDSKRYPNDTIFIADRSNVISCLAYGYAEGIPLNILERLCSICDPPKADKLYVLQAPLEVTKKRLSTRPDSGGESVQSDRFDSKGEKFFKDVQLVYNNLQTDSFFKQIASKIVNPDNIQYIDANRDKSIVLDEVLSDLKSRLS